MAHHQHVIALHQLIPHQPSRQDHVLAHLGPSRDFAAVSVTKALRVYRVHGRMNLEGRGVNLAGGRNCWQEPASGSSGYQTWLGNPTVNVLQSSTNDCMFDDQKDPEGCYWELWRQSKITQRLFFLAAELWFFFLGLWPIRMGNG